MDWRDEIITVLGWWEGAAAEREGRPAGSRAESPAEKRFGGTLDRDPLASHIIELAEAEADANGALVAPAHLLVALLRDNESIGGATGRWFGMSPGRVRAVAGLRNERRIVAGGAPSSQARRSPGGGPFVLSGGGTDSGLLAEILELANQRAGPGGPSVVLVDLGWRTRPPHDEDRRAAVARWVGAGAPIVADSGITDRVDAGSPEVCDRLNAADLVWFGGGDAAEIYDRLWATPALDAIGAANERGAVMGGVSAGAAVWGAGTLSDFASLGDPEPFPLFAWLDDLVIFGHYAPPREAALRERVASFPGCRGLAIAHGGAILVKSGDHRLRVLRHGAGGIDNVLLAGPGEPLSTL